VDVVVVLVTIQIEHPVYKNYIAAGALAVLLILAAVMFWAIFLAPTENPKVDPKAVERMQKGQNERYSDEPPPKKTVCCSFCVVATLAVFRKPHGVCIVVLYFASKRKNCKSCVNTWTRQTTTLETSCFQLVAGKRQSGPDKTDEN